MAQQLQLRDALVIAAKVSKEAYLDDPGSLIARSKILSATAILEVRTDLNILAFRGSESLTDWMINFTALPVPYHGNFVHAGFALALGAVWDQLRIWFSDRVKSKPLLITGHSLGGAMAELAAVRLADSEFTDVSLITFGKPNTFLKNSSPRLDYLTHQISVVSGSDLVTRVPRFLYKPSQSQDKIYLANNERDYWNPSRDLMLRDIRLHDSFSDHSMALYSSRIDRLCSDRNIEAFIKRITK